MPSLVRTLLAEALGTFILILFGCGAVHAAVLTGAQSGLWQVAARRDPSFETNMHCDLQYIENWSLYLDVRILLQTVAAVLRGEGN